MGACGLLQVMWSLQLSGTSVTSAVAISGASSSNGHVTRRLAMKAQRRTKYVCSCALDSLHLLKCFAIC